jgi:hypothetical protein
MGFQKIFNGETGIAIRNKLNSMLSELYGLVSHIFWHKTDDPNFGRKLTPDTDVKAIELEENNYGLTMLRLKNTNDTENYAGCLIAMKGSGQEYTNTGYFGFFGAGYYVSSWAGNAVLATDKKLILSAHGDNSEIQFQVTGGATSPRQVAKITKEGILRTTVTNYTDIIGDSDDFPNIDYTDNTYIRRDMQNISGDDFLDKINDDIGVFSGTITFKDQDSYVHTIEIDRGVITSWTKLA